MKLRVFLAFIMLLLLTGCSSKYTYHVNPTPLKEGKTKYSLDKVWVKLTFGHGNLNDGRFENQDELTQSFRKAILKNLKDKDLLADSKKNADALVQININYKRFFNHGGKALNKPLVSFKFDVYGDKDQNLAEYTSDKFTTSYGSFGDIAVNVKIAAFKWGKEGELKDVNAISEIIVNDLAGLGK